MKTNGNPIHSLRSWHNAVSKTQSEANETSRSERKSTDPSEGPDYKMAISAFEKDVKSLQKQDLSPENPTPKLSLGKALAMAKGLLPSSSTDITSERQDLDSRPGEVEIPDVGSLHSTEDGFEVTSLGQNSVPLFKTVSGGERATHYRTNEKTGTISVFREQQPQLLTGFLMPSWGKMAKVPGYTQSYTIDTKSKEIKDYKCEGFQNAASSRLSTPRPDG